VKRLLHHLHRLIEMEESVGKLWHRLVTGAAERRYPEAAVRLEEMRGRVGILFRALGGDGGLKVETAMATEHGARRGFLQKLAGSGDGSATSISTCGWRRWPPPVRTRRATGSRAVSDAPAGCSTPGRDWRRVTGGWWAPWPVPLWLHPSPPRSAPAPADLDDGTPPEPGGDVHDPEEQRRYRAEHTDMPDGRDGLVLDRFENILSWAEYVKVDRTTEEEEDMGEAEKAAQDLDQLHVARDSRSTASRIRFDLDLPSAESDDTPLGEGILLPEWDWRKATLKPDHCCLQPMIAADAETSVAACGI